MARLRLRLGKTRHVLHESATLHVASQVGNITCGFTSRRYLHVALRVGTKDHLHKLAMPTCLFTSWHRTTSLKVDNA